MNYEADIIKVAREMPVMIVVRAEGADIARHWRDAHTPTTDFLALGKHLMSWERSEAFNDVLSGFLHRVANE